MEATDQLLNAAPGMRFCVGHWLVLDGLVLRSDGFGIKLGEVLVPDIQDILINHGEDFPGRRKKGVGQGDRV